MARITNITFAQVAQIADTMKAAGHRPTARALRERIGSGSMGTIHKLLQQYNGNTSEEREAAELPESIATALMDFIQTEIATACEPIQSRLDEANEEANALGEENERLELTIERLEQERDLAQRQQATSAALLSKAEKELDATKEETRALKEINSNQLREIDRLERNAEADRAALAETREKLRAQTEQAEILRNLAEKYSAAKLEAEKKSAVMEAKLEAAEERATDRAARYEAAEKRAEATAAEAKTANAHYQACAARLEEAARTIDELKKKAKPGPAVEKLIRTITKGKVSPAKANAID